MCKIAKYTKKIEEFKEYLVREEKSHLTIEKYIRDVYKFIKYVGNQEIDKNLVMSYKKELQMVYKISSINSMIISVNIFFEFANMSEFKIKLMKMQHNTSRQNNKELTKAEFKFILENISKKNERIIRIIQAIGCTGIRVSELQYITVESLNEGRMLITNKGKSRYVPINSKLRSVLLDYYTRKEISSGPIFITRNGKPLNRSSVWRQMKNLCKYMNMDEEKVYPHNLRHMFSLAFYEKEKDIIRLSDILGHSSINTTLIYTKTNNYDYQAVFDLMDLF